MTFGERLKELRLKKGFTQEELAHQIGIAKSTLTGYEKGNREPDFFKIKKITQILEVDADYLLGIAKPSLNEYNIENEVMLKFNQLDDEYKILVENQINQLLQIQNSKRKESD